MSPSFFLHFYVILKIVFLPKFTMCKLMVGANFAPYIKFFKILVLDIVSHVHIRMLKMGVSKCVIYTLSRLVSHYLHMPQCHPNIGHLPFKPQCISLIKCLRQYCTINPHFKNYLVTIPITIFLELLLRHIGPIFIRLTNIKWT